MKNLIRCLLFSLPFFLNVAKAQNVAINTDGSTPDASAMLDIKSTSKGFLAPRMTTTQQNAISSPATGLLIFNTTDNFFRVNTGTPASPVWTALSAATNNWLLTGNGGSSSATNFLGTTDNVSMRFRTNNLQRMVIDSLGSIGIGTPTFNATNPEKLLVDAGTTTSVNAIVGKGSIDSYLQLNIQNNSSGANASSDVVATANNGSETTNYVDMGINGGSNASNVMGAANDAYLYNIGQNLLVGTGTASKSLVFMTGGTSQSTNERMRIDGSGNVGIGTNSPSYKLQVSAASNPLQLTGLQTGTNTDSVLTVSNGVVRRLNVSALNTSSSNWLLTGNAGTSTSTNFIGTTDNASMAFRTNNLQRMLLDSLGNVGIGVANPSYRLQVNASNNPLQLVGLQTGTSSDSVLTVSSGVVKRLKASALSTSSTNAWALVGNAGSATTKLGTTNGYDLPLITNNITRMTINAFGNVGIGSTNFDPDIPEKLLVDAGTTATNNLIGAYGDVDNYVQIGVKNRNSGNFASSDIVATADNGTNTTNYIDMGINSSGFANNASNILNRPNVGYLYTNATADFFIGNGAPDEDMILFTNNGPAGNTTANGFEAMRIDGNGNVGIGGTSRNNSGVKTINYEKLVVQGNIVPRTSGNGTIGTSTYKWNAVYATNGTIQTSDRRMKTNIVNLNYGLKEIIAMRPVTFNWKTTPDTNKKVGLIAQEVWQIVPEVVTGDETKETLGLNYAELVPVLINAIKEQQTEISELKKSLQKLQDTRQ